jgi:hypothetical protein
VRLRCELVFDGSAVCGKRVILEFVALTATSETGNRPLAAAAVAAPRPSVLADYATLFKLRVSTMVIITSAAGFYLGSLRSGISPFNFGMMKAIGGIAVVTCGASALNQALERRTDRLMRRTSNRPMAAGRIRLTHGLIVGFLATFLGSVYLAHATNLLTGTLTLLTAVGYVAIYTPLKRFSTVNTFIGAFPGALPPLIGWTAARGMIEWPGVALFAILFVWQFPHLWTRRHPPDRDAARCEVRGAIECRAGALLCCRDGAREPVALCAGHCGLSVCGCGGCAVARLSLVYRSLRPHCSGGQRDSRRKSCA